MNFFEAVKSVFTKYATFSGRARRSEYWFFFLFNVIVGAVIGMFFEMEDGGFGATLQSVYTLAVFIPLLAVTWRRLHDVGKSGKTAVFPYVFFYGSCGFTTVTALLGSAALATVGSIAVLVSLGFFIKLLVLLTKDGQQGANEYGPDPKNRDAAAGYTAPENTAETYDAPPVREEKSYAFQQDTQPADEIQAVVSGSAGKAGKVSLWGDDEEPRTPAAPSIDYNKEQGTRPAVCFCPSCGTAFSGVPKFCTECGAKLK